jgi:hypothetical protein
MRPKIGVADPEDLYSDMDSAKYEFCSTHFQPKIFVQKASSPNDFNQNVLD